MTSIRPYDAIYTLFRPTLMVYTPNILRHLRHLRHKVWAELTTLFYLIAQAQGTAKYGYRGT